MLILAGLSGNRLGQRMRGPLLGAKQKRMKIIAFNGLVFLVPSALILVPLAMQGQGGTIFIMRSRASNCLQAPRTSRS